MDIMLVLIWLQTVCNSYQQTKNIATSKERVNIQVCFLGSRFKFPFRKHVLVFGLAHEILVLIALSGNKDSDEPGKCSNSSEPKVL